jgi:hypothetical protein
MRPEATLMLFFIFGISTLFWGTVALGLWIWRRKRPRVTGTLALSSAIIVVISLVSAAPGYSAKEQARIDQMHQAFAPALERHRQAHGEYPPTLQAVGVTPPRTKYGPLDYHAGRTEEGAPYYWLGFGEPQMHGFAASWDSRSREWTRTEFDF